MQLNSSFTQLPSEMTKPALWGRSTLEMGATHWPESFRHLCRLLCRQEQSQGNREVPSYLPPTTTWVQSPAVEQAGCLTASAPSLPPDARKSPWPEQGLEMQKSNQTAGKEEDSSGSGRSGCPHSPLRTAGAGPRTHWPAAEGSAKAASSRLPRQQALNLLLNRSEIPTRMATSLSLRSPLTLIIGTLSRQGETSIMSFCQAEWNMTSTWE